MRAEQDMR